jgi:catechol 2,3-dioxygenase-like lactoylglutathione lyase family enzyme
MVIVYRVRDLAAGRVFFRDTLGLTEVYADEDMARYELGAGEILVAEGEPEEGGVATIDVTDIKAEAERLKAAGVEVGVVLEVHGQIRLVDVFDPDGNRIQLAQELAP